MRPARTANPPPVSRIVFEVVSDLLDIAAFCVDTRVAALERIARNQHAGTEVRDLDPDCAGKVPYPVHLTIENADRGADALQIHRIPVGS